MATLFALITFLFWLPITCHSQIVDCVGTTCDCPTTFDDTCTLQCDNTDVCKGSSLNCRHDDPCIIQCTGKTSCSAGAEINAGTAEDVTIICGAEDACKDSIRITCGIGHCKLYCDHTKACIDWGVIDVSRALSFQCIGYCPSNIPAPFGLIPTNAPTLKPTIKPTMRPVSTNTNNKPTLFAPTNSPFTYAIITPTASPGITNSSSTEKDLAETLIDSDMFDMIMWGLITLGVIIACIAFICLYKKMCKKRRKSIREARNRGTISTTESNHNLIENNLIEVNKSVEYENNEELHHIIDAVPMDNMKEEDSINSNAGSVSVNEPLNQSESGSDCMGNTSGGDAIEMKSRPSVNEHEKFVNENEKDNDNENDNDNDGVEKEETQLI